MRFGGWSNLPSLFQERPIMSRKKYDTPIDNDIAFNNIVEIEEIVTDNVEDVVDDVTVEDTIIPENIISCKVIKSISNDKAIINVNDCGLIVPVKDNSDSVNIKFVGTIGSPDFKYEVV